MRFNPSLVSVLVVISLSVPGVALARCAEDGQPTAGHKCGYFDEELPATWSAVYHGPDILPMKNVRVSSTVASPQKVVQFINGEPFYSLAQDMVRYGDMNWSQVDYYFSSGRNVDRTVKALQKYYQWEMQDATVGGVPAKMYQEPLDDGWVTKGGPGGRYYFLAWNFSHDGSSYRAGAIIHIQSHVSDEFVTEATQLLDHAPRLKSALSIPYDALRVR